MTDNLNGIDRFEEFWRRMDLTTPRDVYLHPADEPFVQAGPPGDKQLQLQVLPIPVNGNLRQADVVILMLNPNFDEMSDRQWKMAHPAAYEYMEACQRANIQQRHPYDAHPFYDISPLLGSHPGAGYWRGGSKLAGIARERASNRRVSLEEAYIELSRRIAVLQLVPYRSKKFGHHSLVKEAPSSAQAIALARYLAEETDKLLIVQRKVNDWGFEFPSDRENVIVYDPRREARKASLSLKSRGGSAILARLIKSSAASCPALAGTSSIESRARVDAQPPAKNIGSTSAPRPSRQDDPTNSTHSSKELMDRTSELVHLYELSGLKDVLVTKGQRYFPDEGFSKLMFEKNDFRVSSIELYDPKREEPYFRIHYLDGAPAWLVERLALWTGFRNANSTGTNFLGDPMMHAKALANLLAGRR